MNMHIRKQNISKQTILQQCYDEQWQACHVTYKQVEIGCSLSEHDLGLSCCCWITLRCRASACSTKCCSTTGTSNATSGSPWRRVWMVSSPAVLLAWFLRLLLWPHLMVGFDGLLWGTLLPCVLRCQANMGEQLGYCANSLCTSLPEYHAHVRPQVFWILNEAESHYGLVSCPQMFFWHWHDGCSLPYASNMYWNSKHISSVT